LKPIPEAEEARRGALLSKVLKLRKDRECVDRWSTDCWRTDWGTKTDLGLFRMVERIVKDGE
jgi:hypothetical protein